MTFLSLACFVMNASGAAGELKRDNPWKLSAYVKANSLLRSSPRIEMRLPGIKTWGGGGGEQEWEEGGKKKKKETSHADYNDGFIGCYFFSQETTLKSRQTKRFDLFYLYPSIQQGWSRRGFTSLLFFRRNPTPFLKITVL